MANQGAAGLSIFEQFLLSLFGLLLDLLFIEVFCLEVRILFAVINGWKLLNGWKLQQIEVNIDSLMIAAESV